MKVFKVKKNEKRGKALLERAKERKDMIKIYPKDKTYKIIEEYYEVIKELLTSMMYIDGYKTLSHKSLISYFEENYEKLNHKEISIIDDLRKLRNGSMYYGEKISKNFLINYEDRIQIILKKLISFVEEKLV